MLSLLGRGARRLPSVRTLERSPAPLQSRLFGTSDLSVYGYDELSSRQYLHQIEGGGCVDNGTAQQHPSAASAILRWAVLGEKCGGLSLSLKATRVLEGGCLSCTTCLPCDAVGPPTHDDGQPLLAAVVRWWGCLRKESLTSPCASQ